MNKNEREHARSLINRLLNEAKDKAGEGDCRNALTAVRKAKALDPANVFLLALERQVEQLGEMTLTGILTEPQKQDILGSLPRLVDQAVQSAATLGQVSTGGASRAEAPEEREARIAAGRWLKNQYFQRSHEFVRKGEYDNALRELRKIFAIDDKDKVAREFELKIMQMLELQRRQPVVNLPDSVQPGPSPATETSTTPKEPTIPQKKSYGLVIAVVLTLIIVVFATLYFANRQKAQHKASALVPKTEEAAPEKKEDVPIYPVPPAQVLPDSTKHDSTRTP